MSRSKPPLLSLARVIYDRRTGEIVGPFAPIAAEDWPFTILANHETLWRYMDLWKFEDLLRSQTLHFARPDQFTDPFEGLFTPGNAAGKSRSDQAFQSLYNMADSDSDNDTRVHRQVVFINCWHRNRGESFQMWRAYTDSPKSVVVTTSVKALMRFVPADLMKFGVKYAPLNFPRTEFSFSSLFFYKPSDYAFEREFRLLRNPRKDEVFYPDTPTDKFRRIPVRTKKIIHRVITHPRAEVNTKREVEQLLRSFLPGLRRQDSALANW